MIRLILDTSAYSAFMRGHQEVKLALQEAEQIYLNPIILGELLAGFKRGKRPEPPFRPTTSGSRPARCSTACAF